MFLCYFTIVPYPISLQYLAGYLAGYPAGIWISNIHLEFGSPILVWDFDIQYLVNPYWIGKTYISLPSKGWQGHMYPTIVMSWWHHCDMILSVMHLVVQQKFLHCVRGP